VFKLQTQPIAQGASFDCAGLYGPTCGVPLPRWRSKVRFTYTPPTLPIALSLDWRYIGDVKLDANQGNVLLASHPSGITDTADEHIDAYNYIDLSATWRVRDNLNLRAGVTNVADKDPPIVDANDLPAAGPPEGNGNTYPGVYDSLGRTFFIGLTADF
jgi:outer membrane receptor protein involved in Fe transport